LGFAERLALALTGVAAPVIEAFAPDTGWTARAGRVLEAALEPLAFAERLNDPRHVYAYCFCDVRERLRRTAPDRPVALVCALLQDAQHRGRGGPGRTRARQRRAREGGARGEDRRRADGSARR